MHDYQTVNGPENTNAKKTARSTHEERTMYARYTYSVRTINAPKMHAKIVNYYAPGTVVM